MAGPDNNNGNGGAPVAAASTNRGETHQFGTFAGVFTPSILTILGVIMFMRASFVVGQAGILNAIIILLVAKSITFLTSLSIGAISTNTRVRGGGAYYLISRSLGPEFGGAIGIALFFALALSVPFYILGFTEALVSSFPTLQPFFLVITLSTAAILFVIAYVGSQWAIRIQYFILTALILSIVVFMGGAALHFSLDTFRENLRPDYRPMGLDLPLRYSFWLIFAIYFPAVTGIDAGVSMSGDLKDPARSIPKGTLAAVGVGFLIYLGQMILCGGAFPREELINDPFRILVRNALFGAGFLVVLGVFAATLSSAIGSYLSAPRVLQAVSRDPILRFLRVFGKGGSLFGPSKTDEPRRALILVAFLTVGILLWAGNESGGGPLNAVAAIITMFFLYSYGMINLAAFIEDFGDNPSFRPRFRFFHWTAALLGSIGCVVVALAVQWMAAVAAMVLIGALYWFIRARGLEATFGDARRGFVYSSARRNLLQLAEMEATPKNWRPTILVFSGNPESRETLVTYASWLEAGRGFLILADVLVGSLEEVVPHRATRERQLIKFCDERRIHAFPQIVADQSVDSGISMVLQTSGIGPVRPNLAMFGWADEVERTEALVRHCHEAKALGMALVLVHDGGLPAKPRRERRIDLWWRGRANGQLMVLLAHQLRSNYGWDDADIRVLRMVESDEGRKPARKSLQKLLDASRVDADVKAVVGDAPFPHVLHRESSDATCLILGFEIPEEGQEEQWRTAYRVMLDGMPTTLIVHSLGQEDMLA